MKLKRYLKVGLISGYIITVTLTNPAIGQVGGLSASKLNTLCTDPVPKNKMEFEPSFSFSRAKKQWDESRNKEYLFSSPDSTIHETGLGLRFTYGIIKNMEIGISVPTDLSSYSFGAKYRFAGNDHISVASILGTTINCSHHGFDSKQPSDDERTTIAGGAVLTIQFNDELGIDLDAQLQKPIRTTLDGYHTGYYLNMDVGYKVIKTLQLVAGLNYNQSYYEDMLQNNQALILNTGVTIEAAEQFILVIYSPVPLFGLNQIVPYGFGFALTIQLK